MPDDKIRVSKAGSVSRWEKKSSSGWDPWSGNPPTTLFGQVTIKWKKVGGAFKKKLVLDLDDEYSIVIRSR